MPDATPVVPERNDAKTVDIYSRSRANEISRKDPGFVYEYFSRDPKSPSYVGKKLQAHEIGGEVTGFAMVDPWEVVDAATVEQGQKRPDDTKGIDTTVTHGEDILCRTPVANHAKYGAIEDRKQRFIDDKFRGEEATLRSGSRVRSFVSTGFAEDGAHSRNVSAILDQR